MKDSENQPEPEFEWGPIRRDRKSDGDESVVVCYQTLKGGRISLHALENHIFDVAPKAVFSQVFLTFANVKWEAPSTPEERAIWEDWRVRQAARHAKWQWETYWKLRQQFNKPCLHCGEAVERHTFEGACTKAGYYDNRYTPEKDSDPRGA